MINIDKDWTLFLDRDGVINERIPKGYVMEPEQMILEVAVADAIAEFNELFARVIVVTNQQGIGKGLMSVEQLDNVHQKLKSEVAASGGHIDAIYYCPELANTGSNCRKPEGGMGLQAKTDFPEIDFSKSIMVGDNITDLQFGKNLGMKTIFIRTALEEQTPEVNELSDEVVDWLKDVFLVIE
jgi:D-glycero-D-manno-heptose 1,7-bisphosphate phosphatase